MAMERIPRLKICASISSEVCGGGNVGSIGGKYYGKGKNNGVRELELEAGLSRSIDSVRNL